MPLPSPTTTTTSPPAASSEKLALTGNVVNGTIGKQMVDMLVESSNNVAMILKFFDMFLKLKDLTSSDAFKEYDADGKGEVHFLNRPPRPVQTEISDREWV